MADGPYRNIAVPDEHLMTEEEKEAYLNQEIEKAADESNRATRIADRTMLGVKMTIFQNALLAMTLKRIEAKLDAFRRDWDERPS